MLGSLVLIFTFYVQGVYLTERYTVRDNGTYWELVFKVSTGGNVGVYNIYTSGRTLNEFEIKFHRIDVNAYEDHVKTSVVNDWQINSISKVKVSVYANATEVAYFIFDGSNSDSTTWFTKDRLLESSYFFGSTTPTDIFSIQGPAGVNWPNRRFFINGEDAFDCNIESGYLLVLDSNTPGICDIDKPTTAKILYSPFSTTVTWNNDAALADSMAIFVQREFAEFFVDKGIVYNLPLALKFSISKDKKRQEEASNECMSLGGRLMAIASDAVVNFISTYTDDSENILLINGRYSESNGTWHYDNGSVVSYTKFGPLAQVVASDDNSCLALATSDFLILPCDERYKFICQFPFVCKAPPSYPNSVLLHGKLTVGSTRKYICEMGYLMEGDSAVVCQGNLEWSATEHNCEEMHCSIPNHSDNIRITDVAKVLINATWYARNISYECMDGYVHTGGDIIRHCTENQTWTGLPPNCTKFIQKLLLENKRSLAVAFNSTFRYMDDILSINNNHFNSYIDSIYPTEHEIKKQYKYSMSAAYLDILLKIDFNGKLTTQLYDKRNDFPYLCSNIPSSPAYGVYLSKLIRYARACSANDQYLNQEIYCSIPEKVNNTRVIDISRIYINGISYATQIAYECLPGYERISGDNYRECTENRTWSGNPPVCSEKTSCAEIKTPDNVQLIKDGGTDVGAVVIFKCAPNHYLSSGNLTLNCTENYEWSGSLPLCLESCSCDVKSEMYLKLVNDSKALKEWIKVMESFLIVPKKNTSKYQAKLSCAPDKRPSAKRTGIFLGIGILLVSAGAIIIPDALLLLNTLGVKSNRFAMFAKR